MNTTFPLVTIVQEIKKAETTVLQQFLMFAANCCGHLVFTYSTFKSA